MLSIRSLMVRFLTPGGIGELKGNQAVAISCYHASLHRGVWQETLTVDQDPREEFKAGLPAKDLITIQINEDHLERTV